MTTSKERALIISKFSKWIEPIGQEKVAHPTFANAADLVAVARELNRALDLLRRALHYHTVIQENFVCREEACPFHEVEEFLEAMK